MKLKYKLGNINENMKYKKNYLCNFSVNHVVSSLYIEYIYIY